MIREFESLFNGLIADPLRIVVGCPLVAVNYYIIWGEFDPETPNECGGCQGVHLVFNGGEIEFDWAFEKEFRGGEGGIAYHLAVSDHSVRRDAIRVWTEDDISGLNLIPATNTQLWKDLIGEVLVRVEVLGGRLDEVRCSPQAVRLYFPKSSIIIVIGMTRVDDQPVWNVGDGDEVLVLSESIWTSLPGQGVKGIDTLICCWDWPS